jgi:hypothetical protein
MRVNPLRYRLRNLKYAIFILPSEVLLTRERPANRILTGDVGLLWFLFVSELAFTKFLAAALLAADCIDLPFAIRMRQKPAVRK